MGSGTEHRASSRRRSDARRATRGALHVGWLIGLLTLTMGARSPDAIATPFLYVAGGAQSLSQYDTSGGSALRRLSVVQDGIYAITIATRPGGGSLYAANGFGRHAILQYDIEAGGQLAPKLPPEVTTPTGPLVLGASADGGSLYAASDGDVVQYDIGAFGLLSPLPVVRAPVVAGRPWDVVATPDGRSVYVGIVDTTSQPVVERFVVASGRLSSAPAELIAVGTKGPDMQLAVTPDGRSLYVAGGSEISQFDIDAGTGALRPKAVSSVPSQPLPSALVVHPSGRILFAASFPQDSSGVARAADLRAFDILAGGLLSSRAPLATSLNSFTGLALDPGGAALYAVGGASCCYPTLPFHAAFARYPIAPGGVVGAPLTDDLGTGGGAANDVVVGTAAPATPGPGVTSAASPAPVQRLPEPSPSGQSPRACPAGTSSRAWCGDGGPATRAKLAGPTDVAVARNRSLVIADTLNSVIRVVNRRGRIATVAGTGASGAPIDGRASRARFDRPQGVAIMPNGALLVADTGNDAIRAVSSSGRVTTLVSRRGPIVVGLREPTDVLMLPDGSVLISDTGNHRVVRVRSSRVVEVVAGSRAGGFSGDGRPAVAARLSSPTQLALDASGLLIADTGNGRIRRVTPAGDIQTVAAGLGRPRGVLSLPGGDIVAVAQTGLVRLGPDGSRTRLSGPLPGTGQIARHGRRIAAAAARTDKVIDLPDNGSGRRHKLAGSGPAEADPVPFRGSLPAPLRGRGFSHACGDHSKVKFPKVELVPVRGARLHASPPGRPRLLAEARVNPVVLALTRDGRRVATVNFHARPQGTHALPRRGDGEQRRRGAVLWGLRPGVYKAFVFAGLERKAYCAPPRMIQIARRPLSRRTRLPAPVVATRGTSRARRA